MNQVLPSSLNSDHTVLLQTEHTTIVSINNSETPRTDATPPTEGNGPEASDLPQPTEQPPSDEEFPEPQDPNEVVWKLAKGTPVLHEYIESSFGYGMVGQIPDSDDTDVSQESTPGTLNLARPTLNMLPQFLANQTCSPPR